MKTAVAFFLLTTVILALGQERSILDATIVLTGVRIYPSPTANAIDDGVVVMRGGKIDQAATRRSVSIPSGAGTTVLDLKGKVVTAGFQNSHVHFTEEKWQGAADQPAQRLQQQLEAMLVRYGFTTVVDAASLLPNTVALRRRIDSGEVPGPRILTAGLAAYPPDGVPYYVKEAVPADLLKLLPQPATTEQAVDFVRENVEGGADVLKVFTGSWVTNQRVLTMPDNVAATIVAEAHRRNKLVFTHPSNVAGLEVALRAGVDVLAHAIEDTNGLTPDHLRRMKMLNMALIPTLHLFNRNNNIATIVKEVGDYVRSGGDVMFGTDAGFLPDYDPADEFAQMTRAGLTWQQILASLTTTPAARFGESSRRGQVIKGFDADLVVLDRDPATDPKAFSSVAAVFRKGKSVF
jgi:imidazolonepropionase-like amidohydrolase